MGARQPTKGEVFMLNNVRKSAATALALGALGLGGSAIAGAADKTSTGTSSSATKSSQTRGAHEQREALSSAVAAKVKAAALDKVPGATVLRTEAGGPDGTAYHAHIKTSGATLQVVLETSSFKATVVRPVHARAR